MRAPPGPRFRRRSRAPGAPARASGRDPSPQPRSRTRAPLRHPPHDGCSGDPPCQVDVPEGTAARRDSAGPRAGRRRARPVRRARGRRRCAGCRAAHARFRASAAAEAPVGLERHDEERGLGPRERLGEVAAVVGRGIVVVERLGDAQVRVGVEVAREFVALVAQVGLDLEVDVEVEARRAAAQEPPELLAHRLARKVRDVADHARDAQTARRDDALVVVMAAVEVGVGHDRLASDLVEGDVLRQLVAAAITIEWRTRSG